MFLLLTLAGSGNQTLLQRQSAASRRARPVVCYKIHLGFIMASSTKPQTQETFFCEEKVSLLFLCREILFSF